MSRLVLDASVALTWVLSPLHERDADKALDLMRAVRNENADLFVPPHWVAEVLAVVARQEPERLSDAIEVVYALRATVCDDRLTLERAAQFSILLRHHLFDTLYHAVALAEDATMITADERYFAKSKDLGHIALLRDFEL